jgi:fructokinase
MEQSTESARPEIVCLGEILIDMFPAELGRALVEVSAFKPKPGGAPANVAVAAARLGAHAAFVGKVGDDAFGHFLASVLEREGVDTRGLCYDDEARTTMAFIAMPDPNHSEYVFYRNPGADTLLRPGDLNAEMLAAARVFHFGSLSLTHEPARSATVEAVRIVREAGGLVSFDVNYRPSLWRSPAEAVERITAAVPLADLVKVNDIELALLTGTGDLEIGSRALLARGPRLCVVTLGPDGSYFQAQSGGGLVPGFPVNTVDATGCGDAFLAGLLWQLVQKGRKAFSPARLPGIVRYANAVGALTAQTLGVIPALPTAAAVDAFLADSDR